MHVAEQTQVQFPFQDHQKLGEGGMRLVLDAMILKATMAIHGELRMTNWQTRMLLAAAMFAMGLASAVSPLVAQSDGVPRAFDGHPDLNGIWQATGTAHWDLEDHPSGPGHPELGAIGATPPGQGVVIGGEIPYQDSAREQKQKSFQNRVTNDPEAKCYLAGVPRAT